MSSFADPFRRVSKLILKTGLQIGSLSGPILKLRVYFFGPQFWGPQFWRLRATSKTEVPKSEVRKNTPATLGWVLTRTQFEAPF